jgi:hypothetical protein
MKINRFWKETIENKGRVLKKQLAKLHYFHILNFKIRNKGKSFAQIQSFVFVCFAIL